MVTHAENEHLLALSQRHDIPYDSLRDRWEDGARGRELLQGHTRLPVTSDWVSSRQAAELLGITLATLYSLNVLPMFTRKSRSTKGGKFRGAGVLWCRSELETVRQLRDTADMGIGKAARVMVAMRNGEVTQK